MAMSHESEEFIMEMIEMCRARFGDDPFMALQIGAYDAYEFNRLADALPNCAAHAVEANPETWHRFVGTTGRVFYSQAIISDVSGDADLRVHLNDPALSGLIDRFNAGETHSVVLPALTLDGWCVGNHVVPDFLLIDTEGTTLEVLRGGPSVLKHCTLICAEAQTGRIFAGHALKPQIDDYLAGFGFSPLPTPPGYSAGEQGNYWWAKNGR